MRTSHRRDATCIAGAPKLTELFLLLLVAFTGLDRLFCLLGLSDGLLYGDVPAITLRRVLSLESVLVARNLEGKSKSAILVQVGRIGL